MSSSILRSFEPRRHPVGGVPGLTETILSEDPETGDYTRPLHFEPETNTSPMGVQHHEFWEEVWILEGSIDDLTLGERVHRGYVCLRPPDMRRGPWRSSDSCRTFEIRYYRPD